MFCLKCGSPTQQLKSNWNEALYPFMEKCVKCGNESYLTEKHICPKGTKEVRTKASNGYQTCHIPKEWDEKDLKDKNYHSVNIYTALKKN